MAHWRNLFPDEKYVGAWDLEGKAEAVVTIERIAIEELRDNQKNTTIKKPVLYFEGTPKGMVLNKTNARTVAELYSNNTDNWIGKKIAVFATTCQAFGKTTECIRIKNQAPA